MREIFEEIFVNEPLDPTEAARRNLRPNLRKRFYGRAEVADGGTVLLDGKPVKTPARRALYLPTTALAEAVAAEWNSQVDVINPACMPLTRLTNVIIDAVSQTPRSVAQEVEKYLRSDLLFYRAEAPATLVERQSRAWDPVLAWARDRFGARFVLAQGIVYVSQPPESLEAMRAAIPVDPWRLGAVSSITALTGSGLLALALLHRGLDDISVWSAAHVDEDWQALQWGGDEFATAHRNYRRAEFDAATTVLRLA
ncbi:MAG TPA: ATP12 family protein [Pseudolabrys sp.]|jgi:chaperone required for assembly of F1-ATPase|nr:ATP12 family protein [Pseudolabrys sp.]